MKNFPGGMQNFFREAQKMQSKMAKLQEELKTRTVEASSGGGAVKVTVAGDQSLSRIVIDKDVVNPSDVDMLQDLVMAAVNEGIKTSKKMAEDEMSKVTGGMSIPGLF